MSNINALNGISNSFDPYGLMNFYDDPKQKKGKPMKKMTNQNLPKAPKNPKGGGKKGPHKGKGKEQAC